MKIISLMILLLCAKSIVASHIELDVKKKQEDLRVKLWAHMKFRKEPSLVIQRKLSFQNLLGEISVAQLDINQMKDGNNNSPLQYVLLHAPTPQNKEWASDIRHYSSSGNSKIDLHAQNNMGYTVLMLAAEIGYADILSALLWLSPKMTFFWTEFPPNFALKNRKDNNKTLLDYAKGHQESEKILDAYNREYKRIASTRITENSTLIIDISKIIAEYATPVNPHDIEADRAYEEAQQREKLEREMMEVDLGLPMSYLRNSNIS